MRTKALNTNHMRRELISFLLIFIGLFQFHLLVNAQTWIWYPGDYEVWLGNQTNNRRTDRGAFFPPFWKSDSHYVTVEFSKDLTLSNPDTIKISVEGAYNVKLDGKMSFGRPTSMVIPAGHHSLNIKVWNQSTPPSIFVCGKTIHSDGTWRVTNEDKEWIDESGKASDTSASIYMDAGYWNFNDEASRPSDFKLPRQAADALGITKTSTGRLYDFGKETFGYLAFNGLRGNGFIHVYYGESSEEALDKSHCETLDIFQVCDGKVLDKTSDIQLQPSRLDSGETLVTPNNKAFRYVYIETDAGVTLGQVSMETEYLPVDVRGQFRCSDEEVNKMWDIGVNTLHLTTREFFIDGIKRDRWTWSGDAYQSYLMNYYLFFNNDCVKRTIWQLRGKDPVTSHVNTIMDYTFYWFLSIYDYYLYSGDIHFVKQVYPRMKTLMDYVLSRTDDNGMVQGLSGDWVFVDWSPKAMAKSGELSFEQILFCKSLESMGMCAEIADDLQAKAKYQQLAASLKAKIVPSFWNADKQALVHRLENGRQSPEVTRYANMFAIFYDYLSSEQQKQVAKSVLHNDSVMPITTPYMRFYEMEALCKMGEQQNVLQQMKEYWGGMIKHGTTTFWEAYDPSLDKNGLAPMSTHLSMYGRPYGKSLCHAWGASPIYLIGKYFLGVKPEKPGYKQYSVTPSLGGLKWMEGTVPTPHGEINVFMDRHQVKVKSSCGIGVLHINGKSVNISQGKEIIVKY